MSLYCLLLHSLSLTVCVRHGPGGCDRIVSTPVTFFALTTPFLGFTADYIYKQMCCSEITPEGRRITKLDQILLNGNNITMVNKQTPDCVP